MTIRLLLCLLGVGVCTLFCTQIQAREPVVPESREQITLSYAPLVKKTAPAVVNIYTSKRVPTRTSPFLSDPFFEQFFGRHGMLGRPREQMVNSLGSGVIVSAEGLIVTNNHVIKDADQIKIVLQDHREYEAKVVLNDKKTDLSLLHVDTGGDTLPYMKLRDADELEVGDLVLAIGNPFGVGQTVTSGIVSALARTTIDLGDFRFFIQTDAAINPGNSGGALIDMEGNLVGVNTAIFSKSGGSQGIGFAVPSNMVDRLVTSYVSGGRLIRPWLGAGFQKVTKEIADSLGMVVPTGVLVRRIYPGSGADKAGILVGDVIMAVADKDIIDEQTLRYRIATYNVGDVVAFHILRNGKKIILPVTLMAPTENPPRNATTMQGDHPLYGVSVANLSPALADELDMETFHGVVILDIQLRTTAGRLGLKTGDIITTVNGVPVTSVSQLIALMNDKRARWNITAKRGDQTISISVAL